MAYFQNIFSTPTSLNTDVNAHSSHQTPAGTPTIVHQVDHQVSHAHSEQATAGHEVMIYTNSVLQLQELHAIVKHMRSNASPRPDGMNATFYKNAWPWISKDLHTLVTKFYTSAFMKPEINQTFITLIPKKTQPITPQDFRPTSLCNVIYKIISKSLADRLKPHLPDYIDNSQSAFIKNKHLF
jgi:hypothetical protein